MQTASAPALDPSLPTLDAITAAMLDAMSAAELDALPFGVIGIDRAAIVETYNLLEARYAGLSRETVVGRHFFTAVAPCMNNALVAQRLEDEDTLDVVIDYVLTFRMRPTRVKVRLIKTSSASRRYVLIQR